VTRPEAVAKTRGRVLILKDLHDQIDVATADAYGWPRDLSDEQILERLVALNAERAREEAAGQVRWLRPDYQIPRFAKGAAAKSGELDLGDALAMVGEERPDFPKDPADRPPAVLAVLDHADTPLDIAAIARSFNKGGKRIEQAIAKALSGLVRYPDAQLNRGQVPSQMSRCGVGQIRNKGYAYAWETEAHRGIFCLPVDGRPSRILVDG
jgi:hypothetical protein